MSQAPATPHRVIAERVRSLRKGRGWSAQKLAEAMTEVGVSWDRSIVANLENGRRASVSVEELLALAYVLDVAPVHLMVPTTGDDEPYAATPAKVRVTRKRMRAWIRGLHHLPGQDPRKVFAEVPISEYGKPIPDPSESDGPIWTTFAEHHPGAGDGERQ